MGGVRETAELLKKEVTHVRKGKIRVHKGGLKTQDSISLKDIAPNVFETKSCSSCKHHSLIPVGRDLKEIH